MHQIIQYHHTRLCAAFHRLVWGGLIWLGAYLSALAETSDNDDNDYDPLPGRSAEQIEALIFNFDEVVETVILYTALFALLLILLCLAGSMKMRRWVGYTLLSIASLAWFAFYEQHATGLYWIGVSPSVWALCLVGAPLISAHFTLAGWYARWRGFRVALLSAAPLPLLVLLFYWAEIATAPPPPLIGLALLAVGSHLFGMPLFQAQASRSLYTLRNGSVVALALALTAMVVFGELDEGLDISFAIRSVFVAVVLLFAFFLVQSVVIVLRDRDASRQRALRIAQREAEQAKALFEAEKNYARARETARRHTQRLATASHDIRQPITSLRATMAAVAKNEPDAVQTQLKSAFDYLDQLAQSYMETDTPPNAPAPEKSEDGKEWISAEMICGTLDRMFRKEAEAKGLRFDTRAEAGDLRVQPLVLTRILSNLLSNAIKHTQEGEVSLTAAPGQAGFVFSIHNTASLPDEPNDLFLSGEKGPESDGSGFGLAIIQELSQRSGLQLDWRGDKMKGTEFFLTVPRDSGLGEVL